QSDNWASNLSEEDGERTVLTYKEHTYVVLEPAELNEAYACMCIEDNKLVLLKQIGKGAQGVVYLAHDLTSLSSPFVVVKQLSQNRSEHTRQKKEMYLHSRATL